MLDGGTAVVNVVANGAALSGSITSGVKKSTATLGSFLASTGKALGITLGATLVVGFAKKSLEAFDQLDKAQKLLEVGLEHLGQAAQLTPLEDSLNRVSDATFITRDATDSMAASILNLGHVYFQAIGPQTTTVLPKIVQGFDNIAAAGGRLAARTLPALERVLFTTPEKAIPLLQKLGVITANQADKYTALAASGQTVALRQELINKVIGAYPGAAADSATATQKLGYAMKVLEENVGKLILPLVDVATAIAKWAGQNTGFVETIAAIAAGMLLWFKVLHPLAEAFQATAVGEALLAGVTGDLAIVEGITVPATAALAIAFEGLAASVATALLSLAPVAVVLGTVALVIGIATGKLKDFGQAVAASFVPPLQHVADVVGEMRTAGVDWATAVKLVAGNTGELTVHIDKAGKAVSNFGGLTQKAMGDFKKAVIDSVQVTIGDFKKVGDAFTLTTQQLKNQANAAVRIALQEHRDLQKIFADKSLSDAQKQALASLPADQRRAWAEGGKAAREQITKDALQLQRLNDQTFHQITRGTGAIAKSGGKEIGLSLTTGAVQGITLGSNAIATAAADAVRKAIAAARAAAGAQSPSKEMEKLGKDMIAGLDIGLRDISHVTDRLKTIIPLLRTTFGVGAADQAQAFLRSMSNLEKQFDRLKQKAKDFHSAIVGAFSNTADIVGTISQALSDFTAAQTQFAQDQASFISSGGTGTAPVAPTAPDIGALVAAQVAQAQQLAKLLKQLQGAGLSTPNLAQVAGLDPTAAIAIAQALLNDPSLIGQLNQAQSQIADITQAAADKMTQAAFGDKVQKMADQLASLTGKLHDFFRALQESLATYSDTFKKNHQDLVHALDHLVNSIETAAGTLGSAGTGGGQGGPGGPPNIPGGPPNIPGGPGFPGGGWPNNITVNVHGDVISEGQLIDKIHEGLLQKQKRNSSLGFR